MIIHAHICCIFSGKEAYATIRVDGQRANIVITDEGGTAQWNMASSRVILHLNKGQQVYVRNENADTVNVHGLYTIFSGHLVSAD